MLNAREGCSPVSSDPFLLLRLLLSLLPRRTGRGRLPRETVETVFGSVWFDSVVRFSSARFCSNITYVKAATATVDQDHKKALMELVRLRATCVMVYNKTDLSPSPVPSLHKRLSQNMNHRHPPVSTVEAVSRPSVEVRVEKLFCRLSTIAPTRCSSCPQEHSSSTVGPYK